jgi:hypothetical protein
MAGHWTVHRWWVPADVEGRFVQAWRALAEMLVVEGRMERVGLFADAYEPRVRCTPLRWSSSTARRAWRADVRHRSAEDAIARLCDGARVQRMTSSPRRHLLTHTTSEGDRCARSSSPLRPLP